MSATGILQKDPPVGVDYVKYIEETLEEARVRSVLSTPEYWKGYYEGLSDGRDESRREKMDKAATAAYLYADQFWLVLKKSVGMKAKDVVQCRYGLDYTTKWPTILIILPSTFDERMGEIMTMAAAFSLHIFRNPVLGIRNFEVWVITDHSLDQELIDNDFPFYREFSDADA